MDAGGEGEIKENKVSVADKLVLIGMRGVKLFHTPDGVGYGAVTLDNGGTAILGTEKPEMRKMLAQRYYADTMKAPSGTAVTDALSIISGIALWEGEEIVLSTRVAWNRKDVVYDMSNPQQESVVITSEGWKIKQCREPMFKRFAHQLAQTTPVHGGDINKIFESVNVAEEDKLMTLVHLVSSLVPGIPHPAPSICGEQGTAKSTASKVFKLLVDPSEIDTATMPVNEDRMHQMLSKHHYLIFDNVSWIQDWQSDVFCRAVTGQATALRKLYTDDDDHIFKYKMCVGFNGITYLATRSDLLDRSFMLRLVPITDACRLPEDEVDKIFESNRGEILGGMLDALSRAIKIYPDIKLEKLPRMADFTKWGCAISEGLGYTTEEFLSVYYTKIEESNMSAIEANPVAELIVELMGTRDVWTGSATELYNILLDILSSSGARAESVKGLTSPRSLGKIHDRLSPNLRKIGIDWRIMPRTNKARKHQIVKSKPTTPIDDELFFGDGDDINNGDDIKNSKKVQPIAIGDDKTKKGDVMEKDEKGQPIAIGDDKRIGDVCTPYLSFFKNSNNRGSVTKGAQTSPIDQTSPNDSRSPNSVELQTSPIGHETSLQQKGEVADGKRKVADKSTGENIMKFITEKMVSYGDETDHKFDVIAGILGDMGHNTDDVKFCIKRYKEGHRMFMPRAV